MPFAPKHPCTYPGCKALLSKGEGSRCKMHLAPQHPRPSARRRGYDAQWEATRAEFLRANPCCSCGCGELATDVDHKTPKALGGTDDWSNLEGFTHGHHSRKTASQDGGFGNPRKQP